MLHVSSTLTVREKKTWEKKQYQLLNAALCFHHIRKLLGAKLAFDPGHR